ncbi:MAG TPA: DEAD/DEAH box helicase, partial [Longimicrobiaceae bacterium]|nr:DEAD/DEAH box helicase [Longimicrobiaceae bacterium]
MTERKPEIEYRQGLAVLRYVRENPPVWMTWDERTQAYVAAGSRLPELRAWGREHEAHEAGQQAAPLERPLLDPREPRDYQREALRRWSAADGRGTVVLPTGAGKTLVALMAIEQSRAGACVVAPTRALVAQWFAQLADAFGADAVGTYYADEKEVRPLTVTTYHSAFALMERWGGQFGLLVLDEAHHLADTAGGQAKAWHDALTISPALRRLGLTATYPDGRDAELRRLVGPVAFRRTVGEMTDAELARFAVERRFVALAPDERVRYDRLTETYEGWWKGRDYAGRFADAATAWRVFVADTRHTPAARRAYRAYLERERVVALSAPKLREAERILRLFPAETAILFCGRADAAERLSRRLAIPLITADTPASERKATLDAVR